MMTGSHLKHFTSVIINSGSDHAMFGRKRTMVSRKYYYTAPEAGADEMSSKWQGKGKGNNKS
jgi:hypothetical protein